MGQLDLHSRHTKGNVKSLDRALLSGSLGSVGRVNSSQFNAGAAGPIMIIICATACHPRKLCPASFLDLALLQWNSNHFGQTRDEPTNVDRRVSICSIRALCLDSPHNIYLRGCYGFGFLCFFFFLKLSYEVQIYDGFLGRGNERIEERGEDGRREGCSKEGREERR